MMQEQPEELKRVKGAPPASKTPSKKPNAIKRATPAK